MIPGWLLPSTFVVVALAVGLSLRSEPTTRVERAYVPEFDQVSIPVPIKPVPVGMLVRDIKVKMVSYPGHQIPEGAMRDLKSHKDDSVLAPLPAGLPIIIDNIGSPSESDNPVSGKIPPGMRAMTIKVDAASSVEGWAGSGSLVDVLLIEKGKTSVIAEKVRVLSVDHSLVPVDSSNSGTPSTVTLLVTQDQCLSINTAVPLGKIAFALRSSRDDSGWESTSYTAEALQGSKPSAKPAARISGFASVRDGDKIKQFALSDGHWITADGVSPDLFHPSKQE